VRAFIECRGQEDECGTRIHPSVFLSREREKYLTAAVAEVKALYGIRFDALSELIVCWRSCRGRIGREILGGSELGWSRFSQR
jgi:hypothetical protein